jgi:hypothetical protein
LKVTVSWCVLLRPLLPPIPEFSFNLQ